MISVGTEEGGHTLLMLLTTVLLIPGTISNAIDKEWISGWMERVSIVGTVIHGLALVTHNLISSEVLMLNALKIL